MSANFIFESSKNCCTSLPFSILLILSGFSEPFVFKKIIRSTCRIQLEYLVANFYIYFDENNIKFKQIHLFKNQLPTPFPKVFKKKYLFLKNFIAKSVISFKISFYRFTCFKTPHFFVSHLLFLDVKLWQIIFLALACDLFGVFRRLASYLIFVDLIKKNQLLSIYQENLCQFLSHLGLLIQYF